MVTAALGGEIKVNTVDGPVTMKVPAGTQSGSDFKLSGHGAPHIRSGQRGAQIVTVIVDTPVKLTKEQTKILEEFRAASASKKGFWS
jgi:molecular chaperone DnaJ